MVPHLPLLMCSDANLASGHCAAKQNKAFCLVLCEICVRMVVFDYSLQQPSGARQAAALLTDCRQGDFVGGSHIPDVFVFSAIKTMETFGGFQRNPKAPPICHLKF